MLSFNDLIKIKPLSPPIKSLLVTLLFILPVITLAGNEELGAKNEDVSIEFIENVNHLHSNNNLNKNLIVKLLRAELVESYEIPLRKVKVNVQREDHTINLIVYLLPQESYALETVLIHLNLNYQILSIERHYEQEQPDFSSSVSNTCPDDSVDMVFATPEDRIPTAVSGVEYACNVAEAAGYKCINLIGNEATIAAYQNYLACDLKAFGNIGHGSSNLILLHDGTLSHSWFGGLSNTELNDMVIYFNSCEVHNDPLLSSIINAGTRTYIGGILPLWIGPSEQVFKCFWKEVLMTDTAMAKALFDCEANEHYPDPGAHGIVGDMDQFLEEPEYNCCSYEFNGTTFCDASLGSYTFEECKELAQNAGAKQFKWGQVDEAMAEICWAGGTCGDTQEYLPVTLDNLTTSISDNQLVIQWDTALEKDNLGMNLWCAQMQGNQFEEITQLNSELIPSKAILANQGASYSSIDYPYVNTSLKPGIQYCTLEDMNARGQCALHCDQIDTVVVGAGNNISDIELNELQVKAIALCNEHKPEGVCLEQLLAPNQ
jgi:hypothetical protein